MLVLYFRFAIFELQNDEHSTDGRKHLTAREGRTESLRVSPETAVGALLSGQVSLKDSSTPPHLESALVGGDGSFAIDVTGMKAPYVLQATGSTAGASFKLSSYADVTGTANVNLLSGVIFASAAGVDDPSDAFDKADAENQDREQYRQHGRGPARQAARGDHPGGRAEPDGPRHPHRRGSREGHQQGDHQLVRGFGSRLHTGRPQAA